MNEFNTIAKLFNDILCVNPSCIKVDTLISGIPDSNMCSKALGLDDLDIIEITMAIEDHYNIHKEMDDRAIGSMRTMKEFMNYVSSFIKKDIKFPSECVVNLI